MLPCFIKDRALKTGLYLSYLVQRIWCGQRLHMKSSPLPPVIFCGGPSDLVNKGVLLSNLELLICSANVCAQKHMKFQIGSVHTFFSIFLV